MMLKTSLSFSEILSEIPVGFLKGLWVLSPISRCCIVFILIGICRIGWKMRFLVDMSFLTINRCIF